MESKNITVGVVGLGLIGGSLCKALKASGYRVLGHDCESAVEQYALMAGTADALLTSDTLPQCQYVFIAVYPAAAVDYVVQNAAAFAENAVVVDCCGVKRSVCAPCFEAARQHGFCFIGGHPMAGRQFSGLRYSRVDLFRGASFVLVPKSDEDLHVLAALKSVLTDAGFGSVTVTSADRHDEMIAYTSQLAHVVSNAYVKSPRAQVHKGFSAGSYRDLTRVARLNEDMWTELFLDNRDHLTEELDILIENLSVYRAALQNNDADTLRTLLREGRLLKEKAEES